MKATAQAPANIAFIKYWGKKDEQLRLPANCSISVNLSNLYTTTTVKFRKDLRKDIVVINNEQEKKATERVTKHLDRIRREADIYEKAQVVSQNNFPQAAGLASSASSFAALTLAASYAAGLELSEKELSILARLGSGSSCRSIPDGFVEWKEGNTSKSSYARSLYPPSYWDITIIVVVVTDNQKEISSTEGHKLAFTSPFFKARLLRISKKIKKIKKLLKEKNFPIFGQVIESEAFELHTIALTSSPSTIYFNPATIRVMKFVKDLRNKGLSVYFTIDAGPNLFLLCQEDSIKKLMLELKKIKEIKNIIINKPTRGAYLIDKHLF